ncbi:MAG: hypothetical protein J1F63_03810 [Oscillospiraceae bacterium]|nr:hypothetical protein [Oscillospiraceae bacterium]
MKKISLKDRGAAFILSLCVLFSNLSWPAVAIAVDDVTEFCVHHPEHTEDCGYMPGLLCSHEHDESCYVLECPYEYTEEFYSEAVTDEAEPEDTGLLAPELELSELLETAFDEALEEEELPELESQATELPMPEPEVIGFPAPAPAEAEETGVLIPGLEVTEIFEPAAEEELHEHGEECYVLSCSHEHDESCGYFEGHPCEFVCEICKPNIIALNNEIMTMAAGDVELLAAFDFENGLTDTSGNGVAANLGNGNINNTLKTEADGNKYLDLSNNAYLTLPTGILSDVEELTVEMKIKWTYPNSNGGSNWAFFASSKNTQPWPGDYIAVVLGEDNMQEVKAQRQNQFPENRTYAATGWPNDNEWHIVKAVFGEDTNTIYLDGVQKATGQANVSLSNCFGPNGVIWFGGATWGTNWGGNPPGEHFNGSIDDIKIWGKMPPPPPPFIPEEHIITENVVDPEDTTVDLFDYWVKGGQFDNDFRAVNSAYEVMQGINNNHLLIFLGYFGKGNDNFGSEKEHYGVWNAWTGGGESSNFNPGSAASTNFKPYQGIVYNKLVGGYPRLDIEGVARDFYGGWLRNNNGGLFNKDHYEESLDYLFDNSNFYGKKTYPNVTGLFRIDDKGYYYFDSNKSFAELNIDQDWNQKTDLSATDGNHITLYDMPWGYLGNRSDNTSGNDEGQFFPFNHWSTLFKQGKNGAEQRTHRLEDQVKDGQPMNHYFGMTVTTKFMQPRDGMISPTTPMTFEFSGDDDVWIFIDDVLVGDIGGIHLPDGISIDFSTGNIIYKAIGITDRDNTITHMSEKTIRDMFRDAGMENSVAWSGENGEGNTFANGSIHTLKFYYMERGNDVSNCSISFNLEPIIRDKIKKVNEDGDPLDTAVFTLYEAEINAAEYKPANKWHTANEFGILKENGREKVVVEILTSKYDGKGEYEIVNDDGVIDFTKYNDGAYFILRETDPPSGYRFNEDIVLQYHFDTNTFTVINKYETGAYASFVARWTQRQADVYYADYEPEDGTIKQGNQINEGYDDDTYDNDALINGLAVVVPVIKQTTANNTFQRWIPMYGSNTLGWQTITDSNQSETASENSEVRFIRDLALAAFLQMSETNYRDWYLKWDDKTNRLVGELENLPGDATRYLVNHSKDPQNADLHLVTLFISARELAALLGITDVGSMPDFADDDVRYDTLKNRLKELIDAKRVDPDFLKECNGKVITDEMVVNSILGDVIRSAQFSGREPFRLLYTENMSRIYRSALYVPNERRELRVRKINPDPNRGNLYINGAVFAIFESAADAADFPVTYTSASAAMTALKAAQDAGTVRSYGETSRVMMDDYGHYQDGLLVFREDEENFSQGNIEPGYAHIIWSGDRDNAEEEDKVLWMKEIYAPDGYSRNNNLIRIEVGNLAIYANATGFNVDKDGKVKKLSGYAQQADGIKVYAALGKLSQTLVKYALNNYVDITLRDILITLQNGEQDADGALLHNTWSDATNDTFDLHYGLYSDVLTSQYGQHTYEQELPLFIADDGYTRIMPRQNQKDFSPDSAEGKKYYADLAAELKTQLYNEAIDDAAKEIIAKKEAEGNILTDEEKENIRKEVEANIAGTVNSRVEEKVSEIITELTKLHGYDAKMDTLTDNGDRSGNPINLDGLFTLMNVVEVSNDVIPISLMISKEVEGIAHTGDEFEFYIKLEDTAERLEKDGFNEIPGEYHAYIHPTDHQVYVLDKHGNKVEAIDPDTGLPQKDKDGNKIYQMRPCSPADHTNDPDHVHLVVKTNEGEYPTSPGDNSNEYWIGLIKHTNNPGVLEVLKLRDGETLAVVGLPQGTKFTVAENIISPLGTQYETTTERRNDMRTEEVEGVGTRVVDPDKWSDDPQKNPAKKIVRAGRVVSGYLQTRKYAWDTEKSPNYEPLPNDQQKLREIVIPPTEVKFINNSLIDYPDTGWHTSAAIYWLSGIVFLIGLALIFFMESRRPADN